MTHDSHLHAEIIRLYVDEQYSLEATRRAVGISRERVRAILVESGTPLRVGGNQSAALDIDRIIALYRAGDGLNVIAVDAGCGMIAIRAALVAAGVPIRPTGDIGRPRDRPATYKTAQRGTVLRVRTCQLCGEAIHLGQWNEHRYTVHGRDTVAGKRERATETAIAQQHAAPRQPQAAARCPGCGWSPCQTVTACGRKLRAQAQHAGRKAA